MIRGKAMSDKAGELMELMHDVVLTAKLDDRERFTQMVLETKAGMEAGVVGSGHSFAASRLAAQRSTSGAAPGPTIERIHSLLLSAAFICWYCTSNTHTHVLHEAQSRSRKRAVPASAQKRSYSTV